MMWGSYAVRHLSMWRYQASRELKAFQPWQVASLALSRVSKDRSRAQRCAVHALDPSADRIGNDPTEQPSVRTLSPRHRTRPHIISAAVAIQQKSAVQSCLHWFMTPFLCIDLTARGELVRFYGLLMLKTNELANSSTLDKC